MPFHKFDPGLSEAEWKNFCAAVSGQGLERPKAVNREEHQVMKLLYFSSEQTEIELVHKECLQAGIDCELRANSTAETETKKSCDTELWIKNDQDTHKALMLCVQLGVGFGKPAARPQTDPDGPPEETKTDSE
jgi:hypothetical protein